MILVDTSALLAATDRSARRGDAARAVLVQERGPFILSPFVLAELDYMIAARAGIDAELALLDDVARGAYELAAFDPQDVDSARALVERYRDLGIGLTDASILVLADKLGTDRVATLDERHFRVARTPSGRTLTLLPADD